MIIHVVTEQRTNFGGGADVEVVNDSQASPDHKAQYPVRRCRPKFAAGLSPGVDQPDTCEVHVAGDFNDWSPHSLRMIRLEHSLRMIRLENDKWEKRLVLAAGRHEYKFIVDGRWMHDPAAQGKCD